VRDNLVGRKKTALIGAQSDGESSNQIVRKRHRGKGTSPNLRIKKEGGKGQLESFL